MYLPSLDLFNAFLLIKSIIIIIYWREHVFFFFHIAGLSGIFFSFCIPMEWIGALWHLVYILWPCGTNPAW